MRLRVEPVDLRDELLEFLRASSCLGVKHGTNEIEVYVLYSVSDRHDCAVLTECVQAWQASHSRASIEIVSGDG